MEKIWAPWRSKYILTSEKEEGCIFCNRIQSDNDKENYVLYRGENTFIIMNIYPYNNGHLMVAPFKHTPLLSDLNGTEGEELFKTMALGVKILNDSLKPDGFNLGMNIGRVGGAGVEDHLHVHVVPRWNGDTNFMPVLNDTKIVSVSLDEMYKLLKQKLKKKT